MIEQASIGEAFENARAFRAERLARFDSATTPCPFVDAPRVVVHLIPVNSFEPGRFIDLSRLEQGCTKLSPVSGEAWDYAFNFEGFFIRENAKDDITASYVQIFRNGIIEIADAGLLSSEGRDRRVDAVKLETGIAAAVRRYSTFQREAGLDSPLVFALSFLQTAGLFLDSGLGQDGDFPVEPISRDDVLAPEIVLSVPPEDPSSLKASFDVLWNSAGHPRSKNFDFEGRWRGPKI